MHCPVAGCGLPPTPNASQHCAGARPSVRRSALTACPAPALHLPLPALPCRLGQVWGEVHQRQRLLQGHLRAVRRQRRRQRQAPAGPGIRRPSPEGGPQAAASAPRGAAGGPPVKTQHCTYVCQCSLTSSFYVPPNSPKPLPTESPNHLVACLFTPHTLGTSPTPRAPSPCPALALYHPANAATVAAPQAPSVASS